MRIQMNQPVAFAVLKGIGNGTRLIGVARFYQQSGGILTMVRVSGLPDNGSGFYGLHIHEGAVCSGTGSHYNPRGEIHPRHAGDLPPLLSCGGRAYSVVLSDRFSVPDILGRTLVIHGQADDFTTQPSGSAGQQIGCGVIQPVVKRNVR